MVQAGPAPRPGEVGGYAEGYLAPDSERRAIALIANNVPLAKPADLPRWLDMAGADLSLLNTGQAPVLLDHHQSVESLVGVVERAWIAGGACYAALRFARTATARRVWSLVADRILVNVSVGMMLSLDADSDDETMQRGNYWRPYEVSLCTVPANWQAQIGWGPPPPAVRAALLADVAARACGTPETWRAFPERHAPAIAAKVGIEPAAMALALREEMDGELARLSAEAIAGLPDHLRD